MSEVENLTLFNTGPDSSVGSDITLRDVFAAFALVGVCQWEISDTERAVCAFELANTMLAEREKQW